MGESRPAQFLILIMGVIPSESRNNAHNQVLLANQAVNQAAQKKSSEQPCPC